MMIELKIAFLHAFKEGLMVFFSPFLGVWRATRQLRGRSAQTSATPSS
jgi:hypothetical protein